MQEEADVGSRQQGTFMSVASVGSAGGQGYNFTVVRKTFHEYKKSIRQQQIMYLLFQDIKYFFLLLPILNFTLFCITLPGILSICIFNRPAAAL